VLCVCVCVLIPVAGSTTTVPVPVLIVDNYSSIVRRGCPEAGFLTSFFPKFIFGENGNPRNSNQITETSPKRRAAIQQSTIPTRKINK